MVQKVSFPAMGLSLPATEAHDQGGKGRPYGSDLLGIPNAVSSEARGCRCYDDAKEQTPDEGN